MTKGNRVVAGTLQSDKSFLTFDPHVSGVYVSLHAQGLFAPSKPLIRVRKVALARLALRVVRARLYRFRDGLLVFFVGVVLLRVAAAVDTFTNLLVAAAPVVMLASGVAIARFLLDLPRS